jgi:hypothetical protein
MGANIRVALWLAASSPVQTNSPGLAKTNFVPVMSWKQALSIAHDCEPRSSPSTAVSSIWSKNRGVKLAAGRIDDKAPCAPNVDVLMGSKAPLVRMLSWTVCGTPDVWPYFPGPMISTSWPASVVATWIDCCTSKESLPVQVMIVWAPADEATRAALIIAAATPVELFMRLTDTDELHRCTRRCNPDLRDHGL